MFLSSTITTLSLKIVISFFLSIEIFLALILKFSAKELFAVKINISNKKNLYEIIGKAKILTTEGYTVETSDVILDTFKKTLFSKKKTKIEDLQYNSIELENFEYLSVENIFKSIGNIKITDKLNNSYEFSQIYIDEKKREIIGTDSKVYLNSEDFKIKKENKPRVFSKCYKYKNSNTKFTKSVFTLCDYRKNNKCPPWELVASEMRHDNKKKQFIMIMQ